MKEVEKPKKGIAAMFSKKEKQTKCDEEKKQIQCGEEKKQIQCDEEKKEKRQTKYDGKKKQPKRIIQRIESDEYIVC